MVRSMDSFMEDLSPGRKHEFELDGKGGCLYITRLPPFCSGDSSKERERKVGEMIANSIWEAHAYDR